MLNNDHSDNGSASNGRVSLPPSSNGAMIPASSADNALSRSNFPSRRVSPPGGGDTVDLGSVFSTLWRRRKLMLKTAIIVMVLGTIQTFRQKSVYQATCSVLLTTPTESSPTVSDSLRDLLGATQPRSVGTQLAIMRSYPVQRAAVKLLPPDKQELLRPYYKLDVQPERDSDAIDLIAESYDPQVAADLANALNTEYMTQYQQQNREQVKAGTREVADQLDAAKIRLNAASTALKKYKQDNRTIDLGEESKARLASITQIESSLRDLGAERAASVAHIKALTAQVASIPAVQVLPNQIVRRPEIDALRGQLNQLELQRIATLRRYRPSAPEVKSIDIQSAQIRKRLQGAAQTEVGSWTRSVNPIHQGLTQDIATTQAAIWSIDARTQALNQAATQERAREALLPEREFRLNQLTNDQSVLQQTYQVLNEKYQSLLVSEGAKLTTARTLAPAEVPGTPIRPRRILSLIMSMMLSLALAVVAAILAEHLDDRIRSVEGVEQASQLPILAQIPLVEGEDKNSLVGQTDSSSPLLESFRLLRTQLMLQPPAIDNVELGGIGAKIPGHLNSVLITSSREGEGKSFCALNLAVATALSGRKVVLIECDLRRPTLHSQLKLKFEPGLTDVILGRVSLASALQSTSIPNLKVLTGGSPTSQSTELLDSAAGRQVLRSAIAGSDFAILNCPPVAFLADTQIIATIADAAILVVAYDEAERSEVSQARDLLDRTGVTVLGTVLNKVSDPGLYGEKYAYQANRTA